MSAGARHLVLTNCTAGGQLTLPTFRLLIQFISKNHSVTLCYFLSIIFCITISY